MKSPYLSVVIPCFDEMANLEKGVLEKVIHFFARHHKYPYEVIVVDDGSRDGSDKFVTKFTKENPHVRLIKSHHLGKAGAVTTGMLEAKGEYILFTDMDQATPIEEVDKLLPYFEKQFDVVIGSRHSRRKGAPFVRQFISRSNIILRKAVIGLRHISDTQCGFKMFSSKASKEIFSKIYELHNGFRKIDKSAVTAGFDLEILLFAEKGGYKIKEVPIEWFYVETRRVNPVTDSIEGLKELFSIRWNQIKGKY